MKPETKLKYAILALQAEWYDIPLADNLSEDEVEELWSEAEDCQDAKNEIRCSGIPTYVEAPYSRHYESEAVAVQCPNGDWVGFTYWHGGGKHSNPEEIDWIEYAYDLEYTSEEKIMTVYTFSKKEEVK